jgi:hypothetical protein
VQYVFPACVVVVDHDQRYVETRFPDGSTVGSTPNDDPHTLEVAAELGYGADTWAMSRDHEIAHSWLAHLEGPTPSRTMWRLAHPDDHDLADDDAVAREEARVLAFQATLDKGAPRPWELADPPAKDATLPWEGDPNRG